MKSSDKNTEKLELSFDMEGWISCAPFEQLLNMEIREASDGRATLTMPFFFDLAQGAGLLHGGALISLADTAVVMAIKSVLPPYSHFGTITMNARFLLPVRKGILTARAEVGETRGREMDGSCVVYDEENRAVLEFSSVFKVARNTTIRGIRFRDAGEDEAD